MIKLKNNRAYISKKRSEQIDFGVELASGVSFNFEDDITLLSTLKTANDYKDITTITPTIIIDPTDNKRALWIITSSQAETLPSKLFFDIKVKFNITEQVIELVSGEIIITNNTTKVFI
jgi:hypothetical protein